MSLSPPYRDQLLVPLGPGDDLTTQSLGGRVSPAKLNLQRLYEQNRRGVPTIDGHNQPNATAGPAAKRKPRLMLMGQRRYVMSRALK